ncbi:MAG TPA: hypothetical protein VIY50_09080 [Steroidobacteraceae bacterium]
MHAIAEIGVVDDIRRDDLADIVILVGLQPRRNEPYGGAVVRVGRDFRDGMNGAVAGLNQRATPALTADEGGFGTVCGAFVGGTGS